MSSTEMTPVTSSNIDSIGYDEPNQIVYVRFLNGSLYIYKGVPQHEFQNLLEAPSHGSYLNRNFKNVFPYERIE
ncbi:KTSC domain-containing protein [Pedobacter sp. GSP4]|uniref:KTSC domain-containing protein n=1 Tax=Pedobacter sp. GSP4 TaxID=3453716 RepID=UPI003EEC09E1